MASFQFFVLTMIPRNFYVQAFRDSPTNKVRARMSVASAIIFGSVFWRMGKSQTSIQDRMGLLQVECFGFFMFPLVELLVSELHSGFMKCTHFLLESGFSCDCFSRAFKNNFSKQCLNIS
jgi:hypothetical protein